MPDAVSHFPAPYQELFHKVEHGLRNRLRYGIPQDPLTIGFPRTPDPEAKQKLMAIAEEVRECRACELGDIRRDRYGKAVPGAGPAQARVMIVGEAPGHYEESLRDKRAMGFGMPFVGPSGKLLDKILESIQLQRQDVHIGNVCCCRPPKNRDPYVAEIDACLPYLYRKIEIVQPWVIIAMGRFAAQVLCEGAHRGEAVGDLLGKLHPYVHDARIKVWPMKHPAYLLHQARGMVGYYEEMLIIGAAIKKAMETLENPNQCRPFELP